MVEAHELLHHGVPHDVGRAAPDGRSEERVAREAELVVDDECDAVVGVTRRRDRLDAEPSRLDRSRHDRDPEPTGQELLVLDVIRVAVRAKDVRRRQPFALEGLEQRLERRAAVDEQGDAARLVADEERVREPPLVHRPLDDHPLDRLRKECRSARLTPCVARRQRFSRHSRAPRPRAPRSRSSRRSRSIAMPARAPIGLAVPGAGPTVTRESALNTLLSGEVQSSLLGGTPPSEPLLELGEGPPPDTLVVLPPPGRSENDRYPIAVTPGPRGLLTSDSTRIDGLVSLADVARGKLEVVESDDPVGELERLQEGSSATTGSGSR